MKDKSAGCIHLKVTQPKKSCYKYTWFSYPAFVLHSTQMFLQWKTLVSLECD